ncbi:MAG: hypothetical protein ABR975_13240, partial [Vulcanimicrobiaceae bacterium]
MHARPNVRQLLLFLGTTVLAACSGGGGSGGSVAPAAAPTASPTATPVPNPRPAASGDAFTYAGTLTQSFTRYATPAPAPTDSSTPAPTPTPFVTTNTTTVSQSVAVGTGASFSGATGLVTFTTKETDAGATTTVTQTSTNYVNYLADATRTNGVDVTLVGNTDSTSNGLSDQTVEGTGNGVYDELPEVTNAQWAPTAARTYTENDPGGETFTQTYNSDGSYDASYSYPGGGSGQVQANSDGSAVYSTNALGLTSTANESAITIDVPSAGQIPIESTIVGASFPQTQIFDVPVWYPSTPPVLASDTFVDQGPTSMPSGCGAASQYASAGTDAIVETRVRLDVVFGELETTTQTSYLASPYGVVCAVLHDDLETYYDYSGQTPYVVLFANVPVQSTILNETLGLQSATLA